MPADLARSKNEGRRSGSPRHWNCGTDSSVPLTAMDSAKVQSLRKKYPDYVPVICEPDPDTGDRPHKLIMPHNKTGSELIQIARDKCNWATAHSKVSIKKGRAEVPLTSSVRSLDHVRYKERDDVLYLLVEAGAAASAAASAVASAAASAAASDSQSDTSTPAAPATETGKMAMEVFKMNSATAFKETPSAPKAPSDCPDVSQKARRMREKYPERAPVLVNQAQCRGLPRIEKKLLVPRNMKVGELRKSLPRHLKIEDCTIPWENVRMLMAGDEVTDDQLMQEIYDCYVDPDDGGLHLALELGEDAYSSDYCPEMQPEPLPEVEAVETVSGPSLEQLEKLTLSLESATQEIAEAHEKKQQAIDRYTAEEERAERAEEREVEALSRLEQAETRVEQAEMTVESLEKDLEEKRHELLQCHEHINQEKEMREMCEAQCKSLEEELRQTQQTLRVAQHAAKQSTKDSSKAQEKQVALEEQLLAQSKEKDDLQRRLKHDDESILKLKEMCTQLKEKLAMKEEQTKTDLERARLQLQASLREGKKQKAELEEQSKAELDRARSQVKALQQEKQKILLEFEAVQREKASLAAEVKAFHAKAAEKEAQEDEDIVLVGWDGAGKPVDSEDAIDSPEGFQLVQP